MEELIQPIVETRLEQENRYGLEWADRPVNKTFASTWHYTLYHY